MLTDQMAIRVDERAADLSQVLAVDRPGAAPRIVAIIPAYNEERFIGSVVLKTRKYVDTVIVIDDGSTDDTCEVAQAAGAITVCHRDNCGKGAALNTGLVQARQLEPDVVVMLDGDGQHLPAEMHRVIAPILSDQADIVVGSRYLEKRSDVPRHRIWGHWGFNLLTNAMSGVPATDSQSGFRAFSPRAVDAIAFSSQGFSVESEMQFLAHDLGLRFREAPITIRYEDKPKRSVIVHGLLVLNGVLRLVGQHRPLLFFGVPGMVVLLLGVGWGGWVVQIYRTNDQLAVGYALVSVLFTILGSLSLFCGLLLHSIRGFFYHFDQKNSA
ncbi:MAG: glycosyltransferase family 2 protein [Anaerolineae bacterium]|nr:glycosyltransferase family 2 protein [Anaerolineae bacterium]